MSTITAVPAIVYLADCMACHRALDVRFISAGCCAESFHPAELCPSCMLDQPAGSIDVEWWAMPDAVVYMDALEVQAATDPRAITRIRIRALRKGFDHWCADGPAQCPSCGHDTCSKEHWRACTPVEDKLAAYHAEQAQPGPSRVLKDLAEAAKAIGNDHLAQQLLDDAAVFGEHDPTPADNADFFGQFEA